MDDNTELFVSSDTELSMIIVLEVMMLLWYFEDYNLSPKARTTLDRTDSPITLYPYSTNGREDQDSPPEEAKGQVS